MSGLGLLVVSLMALPMIIVRTDSTKRRRFSVVIQFRSLMAVLALVLVLCVLSPVAQAQNPAVYVSGGASIYKLSGGSLVSIFTLSGANFESLAGGPDNVDLDAAGNPSHAFMLYACDTAGKQIIRFDPKAAAISTQVVYSGAIAPECGRITASGDFFFTNKNGGGIYQVVATVGANTTPVANIAFSNTALTSTADAVDSSANMTGRGLSEKYQGDLLAVDQAENEVLRAPYASVSPFATLQPFVTSGLSAPVGIARISTGEVFVSNSVLGNGRNAFPPVAHFDRSGSPAAACPALAFNSNSNQVPAFLGTASVANAGNTVVTDTVYLVTFSNSAGTLWTWNSAQGNCNLISTATVQNQLSGVMVAPSGVTLALPVNATAANPVPTTFNFNSNLFQLTATGCTATVTAFPMPTGTVETMIGLVGNGAFPNGAQPAVNLGENGYEIVYVAHWLAPVVNPACTSVFSDGQFVQSFAGFVDGNAFNNPRVVQCDNSDASTEPRLFTSPGTACKVAPSLGVYPVGGPIAGDQALKVNSVFALVNAGLSNTVGGDFCGFQSPLLNPTDPGYPATFAAGGKNTLSVKFKLATPGNCKSGPFIDNATALISVAQIADATGKTVFQPINVNATAASLDQPPIFNAGNQQYQFTLTISAYAPGTYSLTVTFLSSNAFNQTILFVIK
jgi:hypothetical protein